MMNDHESPPQPTTDLKKKRRKRFIYLIVAAVLWYVISYGLYDKFVGIAFIDGENPGIYWLMFHRAPLNIAAITPVVVILVALIIPGFLLEKYPSLLLSGVILFSLFVVSIAALTMFGAWIPFIQHVQTLQYGEHVYSLAKWNRLERHRDACLHDDSPLCDEWKSSLEYMVYQCGQKGIVCHNIVHEVFEDVEDYPSQGELSVDAEGNLILELDGLRVWTYSGDDQ